VIVEKEMVEQMSLQTTVRKLDGEGADATWRGSSFQTRDGAAATGKAQLPTVDNRVQRTRWWRCACTTFL